jgi:hypothetical protein
MLVHGELEVIPSWVAPFDTPQLRQLLAAATIPQAQTTPWWCNNIASPSFMAQPLPITAEADSALVQNPIASQSLLLGSPPVVEGIFTINNKRITRVYYRKRFKTEK